MSTPIAAPPKRRLTTPAAIKGMLALQIAIGVILVGTGLFNALPYTFWPSQQPQFDTPVAPGDQIRRFKPRDMPLAPAREGNPERPYTSTGDMPSRLMFEAEGDTLVLTGAIAPGDGDRVRDHLTTLSNPPAVVRLNSPGGSVRDALQIGRHIRSLGYDTRVDSSDICLSACPYVLASGVARAAHPDAQIGVHQHAFGTNQVLPAFLAVEDIQRGQGEVMAYLDAMGVDTRLMQHALLTPPSEIYILLPDQVTEYALADITEG